MFCISCFRLREKGIVRNNFGVDVGCVCQPCARSTVLISPRSQRERGEITEQNIYFERGRSLLDAYFFSVRTWATNALISSSDKPSAGFILILPSLSLTPSLMALKASSSFISDCSLASVRFLMASFWPILVSPLPSGPWHLAHCLSQF